MRRCGGAPSPLLPARAPQPHAAGTPFCAGTESFHSQSAPSPPAAWLPKVRRVCQRTLCAGFPPLPDVPCQPPAPSVRAACTAHIFQHFSPFTVFNFFTGKLLTAHRQWYNAELARSFTCYVNDKFLVNGVNILFFSDKILCYAKYAALNCIIHCLLN